MLRLLHPAMPFVTEHLWDEFGYGPACSLIRAPWPGAEPVADAAQAAAELDWVRRMITGVRSARSEMNVAPSKLTPILLQGLSPEHAAWVANWHEAFARMGRASEVTTLDGPPPRESVQVVVDQVTAVLPLAGVVDIGAERARLQKDKAKAEAEAEKTRRKLASADFVARAKPEIVDENRERLAAQEAEVARLAAAIARIG